VTILATVRSEIFIADFNYLASEKPLQSYDRVGWVLPWPTSIGRPIRAEEPCAHGTGLRTEGVNG
jgi:hypothetical protein